MSVTPAHLPGERKPRNFLLVSVAPVSSRASVSKTIFGVNVSRRGSAWMLLCPGKVLKAGTGKSKPGSAGIGLWANSCGISGPSFGATTARSTDLICVGASQPAAFAATFAAELNSLTPNGGDTAAA
eukprot:CAMPEP_0197651338 /NCGR_PEP_ID=MMETSP1338-20131121/31971_1 /TAXON_ID=43686 ORGANISM="Pelagodinium beii, Strain RCC1491" /NCGR_SAMPLE_ID=MMETSP1338 /ASSEMBLY_ACC=CAM_ASM_000754 /LENGTH=126 /DNA_ID=CAMNT_0043225951 /DNA_START=22 /DNA_END=402 /DNA_ORIENTATION=-